MRCLLTNGMNKKITLYVFGTLLILSTTASELQAMNEQQPKPSETERRMCARAFMTSLSSVNPTMKPYVFNLNKYNNMNDPVLSNIHAGGSSIHIDSMNITILPIDIVKLKGCITDLDLSKNPNLTIDGIPFEIGELGDNFTLKIKGTPLEKLFNKTTIIPKEIVDFKMRHEKNIKAGTFANLAMAPKSEEEHFAPNSELERLPKETRQHILGLMAEKSAQEKEAAEKKEAR